MHLELHWWGNGLGKVEKVRKRNPCDKGGRTEGNLKSADYLSSASEAFSPPSVCNIKLVGNYFNS